MTKESAQTEGDIGASPTRITSPELRFEAMRALIWISLVGLAILAVYIAKSLLVIFGAMVLAAMIDGGARLLKRYLNIARGWRVTIVLICGIAFLVWLARFAGSQISNEAAAFPQIIETQTRLLFAWLRAQGLQIRLDDMQGMIGQAVSGVGTVTQALGGLIGGLTTLILITIIGIYIAIEPRLYERGVAWILPRSRRADFYVTADRMAYAMRRLMFGRIVGMIVEGIFTYAMLVGYGVVTGEPIPMPALLAILTGLLAFIPNIGAVISGILMVLVGFSGGTEMGLYTVFVYFLVQNIDGYFVNPMIARKAVDLAPALVLGTQLIMGILFGVLGLFLADPMLAMIKVALERRSEQNDAAARALTINAASSDSMQEEEQGPA